MITTAKDRYSPSLASVDATPIRVNTEMSRNGNAKVFIECAQLVTIHSVETEDRE
ncbi:MAG: hypothetical protein M2R45_04567 [Verrucomicrobia subdivision 3 bacterium]|nr:hypothetical protein [Limisphaerales bacterium]